MITIPVKRFVLASCSFFSRVRVVQFFYQLFDKINGGEKQGVEEGEDCDSAENRGSTVPGYISRGNENYAKGNQKRSIMNCYSEEHMHSFEAEQFVCKPYQTAEAKNQPEHSEADARG